MKRGSCLEETDASIRYVEMEPLRFVEGDPSIPASFFDPELTERALNLITLIPTVTRILREEIRNPTPPRRINSQLDIRGGSDN